MKRIVISLLGTLVLCSSALGAAPQNVILFIGDGMGAEALDAGRYLLNGDSAPLFFEAFPHAGWMTHHGVTGNLTDSAASATAIATGDKVNNEVISVDLPGSGAELMTLLELFKSQGKRTGLVTLGTPITDATPAAFGAHINDRDLQNDIANDYLTQTRPNVLFGLTQAALLAGAPDAGYTIATTPAEFAALNPTVSTHYAGLFTVGQEPTLVDMTTKALDIVSHNSPNGFFAMIENENPDVGGHANNISTLANGVIQLADAVQAAVNWATNAGVLNDTLIIVTADHETGGLDATNNGMGNLPGATWTTTGHSQTPVRIFARGPNAGYVTGFVDNTDIPSIINSMSTPPLTETRTFQQDVNGYVGTLDTHVRADDATTTFAETSPLVVDLDDDAAGGNQPSQLLVRFEDLFGASTSQIPLGATIVNAELLLSTGAASGDQSNSSSSVRRMLVDWNESSTWDSLTGGVSADGTEASTTADGALTPTTAKALMAYDVTATVQAWANGASNFGWAVISTGTDGWRLNSSEHGVTTLRPMLSITYVVPEPSPLWLLFALAVVMPACRIGSGTRRSCQQSTSRRSSPGTSR